MRGRTQTWPPDKDQAPAQQPATGPPVGDGPHSDGPELVGYMRVSTREQRTDSQRADLIAAGCDRIFADEGVSGKLASRPELDKAVAYMRPGDTFVITRLSRAMRSLRFLLDLTSDFTERGINLKVLKQAIDTTTANGRLMFHILAAFDEWQRELIVENTLEGLEAAKAQGRVGGRARTITAEQSDAAITMLGEGDTIAGTARVLGVSRTALHRELQRRGVQPAPGTGTARRDMLTEAEKATIVAQLKKGDSYSTVALATGRGLSTVQRVWAATGATKPPPGRGKAQRPGRPPTVTEEQARDAVRQMEDGASHLEAARAIGASSAALYRALEKLERQDAGS